MAVLKKCCLMISHHPSDLGNYQWIDILLMGSSLSSQTPANGGRGAHFSQGTVSQQLEIERQLPKALSGVHMISFAF